MTPYWCWWKGHAWGPWSDPAEWQRPVLLGGVRTGEYYDVTLQHRTCDRCGMQQERYAEDHKSMEAGR